ncbi:YihY/virulence factor BrkB family protein [Haloechinothrix halophila]|uniref:YihY/virulence factor BrkB family protein n=1 Tax=Haloechinothrix halophila TaxID=1069073 RepID=UPI001E650331|nr:YihY/virulence factor BrkB family protein [Haloechinothrix halophila]
MTAHGDATDTDGKRTRKGPLRLIGLTLSKAWRGSIFSESAEAAFWQALSLAPLMLGILGLLGYVSDWFGHRVAARASEQIVSFSDKAFSDEVVGNIVKPTVESMLTEGKGAIASVGFIIALWAGSSAMSSFVDAITVAHDQEGVRNEVWQRIFSLLLYIGSLVLLIIGLPLIAIGPDLLPRFFPESWHGMIGFWVRVLYYPTLGVLIVVALATLYKVALPRKLPWHRGIPGAILAMAIFLLTSASLRFYLGGVSATGYTYGALATPVAFLLFLFFIGLAVVGGAYFNAAIQELWPAKPTRRQQRRWRRLELERVNRALHPEEGGRRGTGQPSGRGDDAQGGPAEDAERRPAVPESNGTGAAADHGPAQSGDSPATPSEASPRARSASSSENSDAEHVR